MDIDPDSPQALKVLTGDNEIGKLGEVDDRALSEVLKTIHDMDDLEGTGFDSSMLANLVFVTRSWGEIEDHNEAAHWVGVPEYEETPKPMKIIVSFENAENRQAFMDVLGIDLSDKAISMWWPMKEKRDIKSVELRG